MTSTQKPTIGILGAGKVGIVLAQLGIKAGYTVMIAGSGDPSKIRLTASILAPGTVAATKEVVAETADIVIFALPLGKYESIPKKQLSGKLVIDAMNYWWEVDGIRPELDGSEISTSELIQKFLPGTRVVKAFSHIGYHELHDEAKPSGASDRKAIAIAGDNTQDVERVSSLIDDFGFDPVAIAPLAAGSVLQPGSPIFGAHVDRETLKKLINTLLS